MVRRIVLGFILSVFIVSTIQSAALLEIAEDVIGIIKVSRMEDTRSVMERNVSDLALSMDFPQRVSYYKENSLSLGWPIAKSGLLGFGSGSAAIGDDKGSMRGAIFEGIGLGAVVVGGFFYGFDYLLLGGGVNYNNTTSSNSSSDLASIGSALVIGGVITMVVARVFQMGRTAIWGHSYNKTMRKALDLDRQLHVAFVPVSSCNGALTGISLVAKLQV
jgi:hypothetical protein